MMLEALSHMRLCVMLCLHPAARQQRFPILTHETETDSPPPPQQVSPEFIDNAIKENLGKLFGLQEAGGRRGRHLLGEVILTRTQLCNMNNITCNFLLLHHIENCLP